MAEYNVNHITRSPHYPQSNGLAEKYVKNLFQKAQEEGKDLYQCLMVYHIPHYQVLYNHQCKYSQAEQLDQVYQCQMQQGDKKVVLGGTESSLQE